MRKLSYDPLLKKLIDAKLSKTELTADDGTITGIDDHFFSNRKNVFTNAEKTACCMDVEVL